MNWIRAIAGVLVLWSSTAWAATLTWTANSDQDLAGYRVYQCSELPCTPSSGKAFSLATLGTETRFNIGTPAVTQYYFITAYDLANNESSESNLSTFTPPVTTPPVTTPPVTTPPVTTPPVTTPPVTTPPVTTPPVASPPVVPPAIGASPMRLSFAATQGGATPAPQTVSISNTGGGTLSWATSDNPPWLMLSQSRGSGDGLVSVSVVAGTTTIGTYNGSIKINAIGASSVTVPVTFIVDTPPAPQPVHHHRHQDRHRHR